jgi:hypothetical protein
MIKISDVLDLIIKNIGLIDETKNITYNIRVAIQFNYSIFSDIFICKIKHDCCLEKYGDKINLSNSNVDIANVHANYNLTNIKTNNDLQKSIEYLVEYFNHRIEHHSQLFDSVDSDDETESYDPVDDIDYSKVCTCNHDVKTEKGLEEIKKSKEKLEKIKEEIENIKESDEPVINQIACLINSFTSFDKHDAMDLDELKVLKRKLKFHGRKPFTKNCIGPRHLNSGYSSDCEDSDCDCDDNKVNSYHRICDDEYPSDPILKEILEKAYEDAKLPGSFDLEEYQDEHKHMIKTSYKEYESIINTKKKEIIDSGGSIRETKYMTRCKLAQTYKYNLPMFLQSEKLCFQPAYVFSDIYDAYAYYLSII